MDENERDELLARLEQVESMFTHAERAITALSGTLNRLYTAWEANDDDRLGEIMDAEVGDLLRAYHLDWAHDE